MLHNNRLSFQYILWLYFAEKWRNIENTLLPLNSCLEEELGGLKHTFISRTWDSGFSGIDEPQEIICEENFYLEAECLVTQCMILSNATEG